MRKKNKKVYYQYFIYDNENYNRNDDIESIYDFSNLYISEAECERQAHKRIDEILTDDFEYDEEARDYYSDRFQYRIFEVIVVDDKKKDIDKLYQLKHELNNLIKRFNRSDSLTDSEKLGVKSNIQNLKYDIDYLINKKGEK